MRKMDGRSVLLFFATLALACGQASTRPGTSVGDASSPYDASAATSDASEEVDASPGNLDAANGADANGLSDASFADASVRDASTPESDPPDASLPDTSLADAAAPKAGTGCRMPLPAGISSTAFTDVRITIATCSGSASYPDCIDPVFAPGGAAYARSNDGAFDYNHRDYTVKLPAGYDPAVPTPVVLAGGGCGGSAPLTGAGFGIGETGAIEIGLSPIGACFADGGPLCAGEAGVTACDHNPELPYFRAVVAQVKAELCVDGGRLLVAGYTSGAWEAQMLACAASDEVRGIATFGGGHRLHAPPCGGPVAALLVGASADDVDPLGPLVPDMPFAPLGWTAAQVDTSIALNDSDGLVPERDAILARNGCAGTATEPYDSSYRACVRYTGCPSAYPVVWCPISGIGRNPTVYEGADYVPGSGANDPLFWGFLSKLGAAP